MVLTSVHGAWPTWPGESFYTMKTHLAWLHVGCVGEAEETWQMLRGIGEQDSCKGSHSPS